MKKRIGSIITLILVFVFLVSGCEKQVKISEDFNTQDGTVSFLNKLAEYNYVDSTGVAQVKLDNITIQLDKNMKGKAASVYKVDYDPAKLAELTDQAFDETYKSDFEKDLNGSFEIIIERLISNRDRMITAKDTERADKLNIVIEEVITFKEEIKKGSSYSVDDIIAKLNALRGSVETYGNENINNKFTEIETRYKELNNISDMFNILYRTYSYAGEHFADYADYSQLYKDVVNEYSDEMLRHAEVYNRKSSYVKLASDKILAKSKYALPFLPIATGEGKQSDIEAVVKDNPDLMSKDTFYHLAAVAKAYRDLYAEDATKQDKLYTYYNGVKKALDTTKSVDLQDNINALNNIKTKVAEIAKKDADKLIMKNLGTDIKKLIKDENTSIKFSKTDSNENSLFAIFTFDNINDLHGDIYVGNVEDALKDPLVKTFLTGDLLVTKAKVLAESMNSPEILAALDLHEKLRYEIDSLNLYVISLEANDIKKNHEKAVMNLETQYGVEINGLVQSLSDSFVGKSQEEITNEFPALEKSITDAIYALNNGYKAKVEEEMNLFLKDFEAYNSHMLDVEKSYQAKNSKDIPYPDKDGISKTIEVIKSYGTMATKANEKLPTLEAIETGFNKHLLAYTYFEQQLPASIVIEVEGAIVNKINRLGNVDSKISFQTNATSSTKASVRLNAATNSAMFLFDLKSFGSFEVKIMLLALVVLLIVLAFVKRKWFRKIMLLSLLVSISVIVIYPILWIIGSSLVEGQALNSVGISPFPKELSLIQFKRLFITTDYVKWYINTFKIALINMTLSVMLTVTTAYVFSRFKFKGKKAGMMTMMILQIFPSFLGMVAIYSLLSSIKIFAPMTGKESLIDTHLGLILVYACGQIPYNVWLVKGYFDTIPKSLDEAAKIDGASNIRTFVEIILPLGRPIIAFVAVTNFMGPWFDFIFPRLILKTQSNKTLAIGLYEMINGREANNFTMFAAGAVLVAVPITALFAYFQKYIVTGLAAGAVKG